jgi:type II secretory pathway component GspD/PulD (secretin)
MKYLKKIVALSSLLLLLPMLASCIKDSQSSNKESAPQASPTIEQTSQTTNSVPQPTLPVRYQTPSYVVDKKPEKDTAVAEESRMKVEAKISSTKGPQPLWDILKRLASLKGMTVSWASDVDQNVLVDVNINANDDFFGAIDNLLRQVDYYHEVQGSTIIVKYKETRQFQISMPFLKQTYKTKTGGDMLGGGGGAEESSNIAGEISLMSEGVGVNQTVDGKPGSIEFNIWSSIENNLNALLNIWSTDLVETELKKKPSKEIANVKDPKNPALSSTVTDEGAVKEQGITSSVRRSKAGNSYFIDKPVGLITVTAPRPLMSKLDDYFKALKKELYKQVSIEAKILEVVLDDSSSIGLNWNTILSSLSVAGGTLAGSKTYSENTTDTSGNSKTLNNTNTTTNTSNNVNTTTSTRNQTFDNLLGVPLTADTGGRDQTNTNTLTGIVSDVVTATALSNASTATVITNGVAGALGGTISLAAFTFDSFLNAVSKQGKATILANPKLSVLNGQPALITVGRNVTYIDTIETDVSDSGVITNSVETARALSGVGLALTANIIDENQIILNLVPVTSELTEPIEYRAVGLGSVGLPVITVREINTTVKVRNGEMLVIGGLIGSAVENEGTFLPGTSNLGIARYLFGAETKATRKRELIVLLKPRIM